MCMSFLFSQKMGWVSVDNVDLIRFGGVQLFYIVFSSCLYFFILNFIFYCYLLTCLFFFELTENNKKRKYYQFDSLSLNILWYEWNNFCDYVFTSTYVSNFVFLVCMISVDNEIGMIVWFGVIILRSPKKEVLWKFWLDPQFLRNPKLKWILKWLPLDKGCFKFYFLQKGKVY